MKARCDQRTFCDRRVRGNRSCSRGLGTRRLADCAPADRGPDLTLIREPAPGAAPMPASSDRKIEANRRNAAKSTGPKSNEGKEKSRRNGWKHGMAAVVIVPEEEAGALEAAVDGWSRQLGPDGLVEESLVHQMAAADVRMRRCAGQRDGDGGGRHRGRPPLGGEATAPGPTDGPGPEGRRGQRGGGPGGESFGCDWLIRRWRRLEGSLRLGMRWAGPVARGDAAAGLRRSRRRRRWSATRRRSGSGRW